MNLGIGVMLQMLSGDSEEERALVAASIGKKLVALDVSDSDLVLRFTDGTGLRFHDGGQSCCENRYMSCDDDLPYFAGAEFRGAETRDVTEEDDIEDDEDNYESHDIEFLLVHTDKGDITIANHNEHNGYYGGFAITVSAIAATGT